MAPDQGYYHLFCEQSEPSLVIEINWSHFTSEELAERAKDLIQESGTKVRTVVNVDLSQIYQRYRLVKELKEKDKGPAPATVSVWRASIKDDEDQVIAQVCC